MKIEKADLAMSRILSYSLFSNHPQYGHRELYWQGIPAVVRAHHNLFTGWEMRVHHDSSVERDYGRLLRAYAAAGLVSLHYVEENIATCRSMLWRMLPAWEDGVEFVMCRDLDSLPSVKDRLAVEEFVQSGMVVHALGDNASHVGLMGGMVGFSSEFRKRFPFKTWEDFLNSYTDAAFPMHVPSGGPDQILMNRTIAHFFYDTTLLRNYCGKAYDGPAQRPEDISEELAAASADLTPFLGAPGFDVQHAIAVFDRLGSPVVAAAVAKAEESLNGLPQ